MSQSTNKQNKSKRVRSSKDDEGASDHIDNNNNDIAPSTTSGQSQPTTREDLHAKFTFHGDGDERPKKRQKVATEAAPRVLQHPYHNWKKLANESHVVVGDKIFVSDLTLSDPKNSNNTIKIHPGCKVTTRVGRVDTANLIVYGIASCQLGKKIVIFVNSPDHDKDSPPYAVDVDAIVEVHENESWDQSIAETWLQTFKNENVERSVSHPPHPTHHTTPRRTISGLSTHEVSQLVQAIITPILTDFSKQFRNIIAEIHEKDENHQRTIMQEFKDLWAANTKMMVDLFSLLTEHKHNHDK